MASTTGITIEEFERLPNALARNHELVDGELVDVSGNTPYHNWIRDYLIELLRPHARHHGLGMIISEQEYDFDGNAHGPDVTLVVREKLGLIQPKRRVQRFVPDLAIEIVSDNDTFKALMDKAERYRRCGTQEVWILDSDHRKAFVLSAEQDAMLGENDVFAPKLLPGFSIPLGELYDRA